MVSEYLMQNYYSHCPRELIPTKEEIDRALTNHPEKIIVIRDNEIMGIGVFLTLNDETYKRLEMIDIRRIDVLQALALEVGRNVHFVLLVAKDLRTIMRGLRQVIRNFKPKTVSWWSPDFRKLHKYEVSKCRS